MFLSQTTAHDVTELQTFVLLAIKIKRKYAFVTNPRMISHIQIKNSLKVPRHGCLALTVCVRHEPRHQKARSFTHSTQTEFSFVSGRMFQPDREELHTPTREETSYTALYPMRTNKEAEKAAKSSEFTR